MKWADFKTMQLPLWEVATAMVVIIGAVWWAFGWADTIEDSQVTTQGQLDQLILVVSTTTQDNHEVHQSTNSALIEQRHALELLKQEIELRRELERESEGNP